jgi:hypothetical protein
MSELLTKFLEKTLDTAVQAGITSLITDVDFEDAFKAQAALNVAGSVLGGTSPFDLFKPRQPAAQPTAQGFRRKVRSLYKVQPLHSRRHIRRKLMIQNLLAGPHPGEKAQFKIKLWVSLPRLKTSFKVSLSPVSTSGHSRVFRVIRRRS